jgi:hypothetical protein
MDELEKLLLKLEGKTDADIEILGKGIYFALCDESHQKKTILTHDGHVVKFHRDRFEHAFYMSSDRARHRDWKDKLAVPRIARIHWIREFVSGNIPGVECWEVDRLDGQLYPKMRVYLIWEPAYIVWLDEIDGGFTFRYSTAYPTLASDLRKYCRNGTRIWAAPAQKDAP